METHRFGFIEAAYVEQTEIVSLQLIQSLADIRLAISNVGTESKIRDSQNSSGCRSTPPKRFGTWK